MNRPTDPSNVPADGGKRKPGGSAAEEPFRPPSRVMPSYVERAMAKAAVTSEPEPLPAPPPTIPFLYDPVTFWNAHAIAACLLISIGLVVTGLGLMYCVWLLGCGMVAVVRFIATPFILLGVLTHSYASACFLAIMETTANGYDKVDDWPTGLWREWFWSLPSTVGMLLMALTLGSVMGRLMGATSWTPTLVVAFFAYPVFQFSVVENSSLMSPISFPVLRTLFDVWWAWLIFYALTIVGGGLLLLTVLAIFFCLSPLTAVVLGCALECACVFVYARLLGRVAWCALKYGNL